MISLRAAYREQFHCLLFIQQSTPLGYLHLYLLVFMISACSLINVDTFYILGIIVIIACLNLAQPLLQIIHGFIFLLL